MKDLCKSLEVEASNGRLWIAGTRPLSNSEETDLLLKVEKNLVDQLKKKGFIKSEDELAAKKLEFILELKGDNGEWPTEVKGKHEKHDDHYFPRRKGTYNRKISNETPLNT